MKCVWAGLFAALTCLQTPAQSPSPGTSVSEARQMGFVAMPPAEAGWRVAHQEDSEVTYTKRGVQADHFYAATALLFGLPSQFDTAEQFVNYVKQARLKNADPARFSLVESDDALATDRAERCVKYHYRALEQIPRDEEPDGPIRNIDVYGYTCIHPQDPYLALDFSYSQRTADTMLLQDIAQPAENYLQQVKLINLPAAELSAVLYNAGINFRRQSEYGKAELLLMRAVTIQESVATQDDTALGRRLAELAATYLVQGKLDAGMSVMQRFLPIANRFSSDEKRFVIALLDAYAEQMALAKRTAESTEYAAKAHFLRNNAHDK